MSWHVGLAANAVLALTYAVVAVAVLVPLARTRQLRVNVLGVATAAIFVTSAVHHMGISVLMLLPDAGGGAGLALRSGWVWPLAVWDLIGVGVGVFYLAQRRSYGSLTGAALLFADLRAREQQALELNDAVLQGLIVAQLSLELEQPDRARAAIDSTIASASRIITDLIGTGHTQLDLVRAQSASSALYGTTVAGPVTAAGPTLDHPGGVTS